MSAQRSRSAPSLPLVLPLVLGLAACSATDPQERRQATSLLGEPLYPMALEEATFLERSGELEVAEASYRADPSEMSLIWYGRRLAYLGRYTDAVELFGEGLEAYPASFRLRRHRGHRYITLRRFEDALADLGEAALLAEGVPDEMEPDGMPNAMGIPRSSTHSNIYYHLGLAHYLLGDYQASLGAYTRCLRFSTNDDGQVSSRYWLYLNLRRLGREEEAVQVLEPVTEDMDVIENFGYQNLLLLFKGVRSLDEVMPPDADGIINATVGYGVSMYHLLAGRPEEARAMWEELVSGPAWPAFGFIAAEAELSR